MFTRVVRGVIEGLFRWVVRLVVSILDGQSEGLLKEC